MSRGDEAAALYEGGKSLGQVAAQLGITRQAVWAMVRRRGIPMRPQLRFGAANHFHRGVQASDPAQNKLEKALRAGVVRRPSACEACGEVPTPFRDGRSGLQAHHDDYTQPLAVRWLCQPCHHAWHRTHTAVGATHV